MQRIVFTLAMLAPTYAVAAEPDPKAVEFFENKIRPVLVEQCLKCHSTEAEKERKLRGGLKLDTRVGGWEKGGDTGPAIVPGKPNEGTLLKSLKYTDPDLQMPPKGKLSDAVIKDFEKWIADGAIDPRGETARKTDRRYRSRERTAVLVVRPTEGTARSDPGEAPGPSPHAHRCVHPAEVGGERV